jgi:hypothetical protein
LPFTAAMIGLDIGRNREDNPAHPVSGIGLSSLRSWPAQNAESRGIADRAARALERFGCGRRTAESPEQIRAQDQRPDVFGHLGEL